MHDAHMALSLRAIMPRRSAIRRVRASIVHQVLLRFDGVHIIGTLAFFSCAQAVGSSSTSTTAGVYTAAGRSAAYSGQVAKSVGMNGFCKHASIRLHCAVKVAKSVSLFLKTAPLRLLGLLHGRAFFCRCHNIYHVRSDRHEHRGLLKR